MQILRLVLLVAVAPLFFIQGCDSTSNESLPNSGQSLCMDLYEMCIDPIFHNSTSTGQSCSQAGCHNPPIGQDGFFLYPGAASGSPEIINNFNQVEARTLNNNLLLSKATGNNHGGNQQLQVGDLCYRAIQEWSVISFAGGACPLPPGSACEQIANAANPALLINISCGP